jgi:hypothetical protein
LPVARVDGLTLAAALKLDAVAYNSSFIGRCPVERMDLHDILVAILG